MIKKTIKRWMVISFIVFAYVAYPYVTLYQFTRALETGDKQALESFVNWDNVRKSVKEEMNAALSASVMKEASSPKNSSEAMGAAFAMALIPKMIDGMIDTMLTPAGLAHLLAEGRLEKETASDVGTTTETPSKSPIPKHIRYAFFSGLATFRVEFAKSEAVSDDRVIATMTLQSGVWKLDNLSFPGMAEAIDKRHTQVNKKSSSAAGNMVEAELPPSPTGKWNVSTEINPVDDSKTVILLLAANGESLRFKRKPILIIRCKSQKTEVYINWDDYLGSDTIPVVTRIGTEKASNQLWSLSSDHKASFYPNAPVAFIQDLMKVERFVAETTPYGESPVTAVFDTAGLKEAIKPVQEVCKWPSASNDKSQDKKPMGKKDPPPISKDVQNTNKPTQDKLPLSLSEKNFIRSQFAKCWVVPAGVKDAQNLIVTLDIELDKTGTVQEVNIPSGNKTRYASDSFFRAMVDSVARAVWKCNPLKNLQAERYDKWKNIELTFDPKEMLF